MAWGFRVATDANVGGGHAARCAALARAMDTAVVAFVDPEPLPKSLDLNWACSVIMEEAPERLEKATAWLAGSGDNRLIVDGYAYSDRGLDAASQAGKTAVFRDGPPYGPEDVTIDVNPGAREGTGIFAGPSYVPLPEQFSKLHATALTGKTIRSEPLSILIAFGVRDSANHTCKALQGLIDADIVARKVVAAGREYENMRDLDVIAGGSNDIEIWDSIEDLPCRYGEFDLAIGGPGVSQSERTCCGLPTVLIAQNAKHEPLVRAWDETGAAVTCKAAANDIGATVRSLAEAPEKVDALRKKALALIDGRGAVRLAHALQKQMEAVAVR